MTELAKPQFADRIPDLLPHHRAWHFRIDALAVSLLSAVARLADPGLSTHDELVVYCAGKDEYPLEHPRD